MKIKEHLAKWQTKTNSVEEYGKHLVREAILEILEESETMEEIALGFYRTLFCECLCHDRETPNCSDACSAFFGLRKVCDNGKLSHIPKC